VSQVTLKGGDIKFTYESSDHSILFIISGDLIITKISNGKSESSISIDNQLFCHQYESVLIEKCTKVTLTSQASESESESEFFIATSNY
jgi:hypothetical protein